MEARTPAERLIDLLALVPAAPDEFRGETKGRGPRLFGGLIAAQAVLAAGRTVSDAELHSLHAYFLRPGRPGEPVLYRVTRAKEGKNFQVREVSAVQREEIIFTLHASFARPESGIEHQDPMPDAPPPDDLPDRDRLRGHEDWAEQPIEIRTCDPAPEAGGGAPSVRLWIRPRGSLPDDARLHEAFLVYASDRALLSTASRPHDGPDRRRRAASLDHALWLHRPVRFDDWLLYTTESPAAHAARAFCLGAVYDRAGRRIASVAQEGLLRYQG